MGGRSKTTIDTSDQETAWERENRKREQERRELDTRRAQGLGFKSTILTSLANPGQAKTQEEIESSHDYRSQQADYVEKEKEKRKKEAEAAAAAEAERQRLAYEAYERQQA